MIELKEDNLNEVLASNEKVIVQYGAAWCGACRMVKPKFKKMSEENDNITFVYVDAEKLPNSRQLAQVSHLPTFALFNQGQVVDQKQGNKIDVVKELVDAASSN